MATVLSESTRPETTVLSQWSSHSATVVPPAVGLVQAHEHAMRSTLEATVKELADLLTPRLVAYIGGVRETRAVHQWAEGTREIKSPEVEDRLRFALQVAVMLAEHDSPRVVQAWFQGLNPHLEDRSPARLLREGDLVEVGPAVLGAARAFLIGG